MTEDIKQPLTENEEDKKLLERIKKEKANAKIKIVQENNLKVSSIECTTEHENCQCSDEHKYFQKKKMLTQFTGSANEDLQTTAFCSIGIAFPEMGPIATESHFNAAIAFVTQLNPADAVEAQLAQRLYMLNQHINYFAGGAIQKETSSDNIDRNVNRVVKLSRIYNETAAALDRYQRKGAQNVVVQHVNVNSDKTIVTGTVTGVTKKSED